MSLNNENAIQIRHRAEGLYRRLGNYTNEPKHMHAVPHSTLHRWRDSLKAIESLSKIKREPRRKVQVLFNRHALWVGVHYSKYNRRLCINLLPGVTICITQAGGIAP